LHTCPGFMKDIIGGYPLRFAFVSCRIVCRFRSASTVWVWVKERPACLHGGTTDAQWLWNGVAMLVLQWKTYKHITQSHYPFSVFPGFMTAGICSIATNQMSHPYHVNNDLAQPLHSVQAYPSNHVSILHMSPALRKQSKLKVFQRTPLSSSQRSCWYSPPREV